MERHALITGGAGFIGSHFIDALIAEGGWRITVIDNMDPFYPRAIKENNISAWSGHPAVRFLEMDILDPHLTAEVAGEQFDVLVHFAAKAGVRPSIHDPLGYHRVNVTGTLRLLELARAGQVPHFVLASSSSVYGEDPEVPWRERERGLLPISPYAATKLAAEGFAQVYAHLHGMQVTALRFFTVYGPRQRPDLAIHKFFRHVLHGRPIQQYGDGSTRRDYTFVDDIVQGVRAAVDRREGGRFEIYNLGNSGTVALRELIAAIEREAGRTAVIERHPEQPGDVPQTYADVTKAHRDLGFVPGTPLSKGLAAFHHWYRDMAPVLG